MPAVPPEFWLWIAVLIPLELLAALLYATAIRDAPFFQTVPFLAFTPVFNIATGWWILGEQVSWQGAAGVVLVVVGAYWLNIDTDRSRHGRDWLAPLRAVLVQKGSRRMLAVAMIYSITSVGGKGAMMAVGPIQFVSLYFSLVGLAALLLALVLQPGALQVLQCRPARWLWIGGLLVMTNVAHFLAIANAAAAYMVAVKRTSLLFGIAYGAWWFQESGFAHHIGAAAVMLAGVVLIATV